MIPCCLSQLQKRCSWKSHALLYLKTSNTWQLILGQWLQWTGPSQPTALDLKCCVPTLSLLDLMTCDGMAVTCDHRIRSLATINKKTGFGSLVTTKCGHLRPQKVTFADRANKTQKCMRSLATTICGHLRPKIGIAWPGWVGWGGWGGMITYLALAHTLAEHIPCIHGWVGWVGWDDHVPCTCTHPSRTHPLYSWVGGVGGVGGMITYLALAHTLAEHIPCIHGWVGWVGWGGMITYLALAHTLAEHIPCIHGWVGWVGQGGMITSRTLHLHTP